MKNRHIVILLALFASMSSIAACSSSFVDAPAATAGPTETVDRNLAVASCGVMVRLLNGDMPVNADTYDEVEKTLRTFAEKAPGEVKLTAQFVLEDIEGAEHTDEESQERVDKLKDYCMNYTVD